jgi:AraC-like DNA-binding protein
MGSSYREIAPSPDLSALIECFWVSEVETDERRRILPDGCLDLLFFSRGKQLVEARVVGVMTRPHEVSLCRGLSILGVRFQPGMAGVCLPCEIPALNDRTVPLQAALGDAATDLLEGFADQPSVEASVEKLAHRLSLLPTVRRVRQAIGELVGKRGQLSIADLADAAGIGQRQLRRHFISQSGLAPKQLTRILRFRHAASRLRGGAGDFAGLAIDCGYYDQAHMIRDFRELAGITPARFMRQQGQ